jgi:hypothetical protein
MFQYLLVLILKKKFGGQNCRAWKSKFPFPFPSPSPSHNSLHRSALLLSSTRRKKIATHSPHRFTILCVSPAGLRPCLVPLSSQRRSPAANPAKGQQPTIPMRIARPYQDSSQASMAARRSCSCSWCDVS